MGNAMALQAQTELENVDISTVEVDEEKQIPPAKYIVDVATGDILAEVGENDRIIIRKATQIDYYETHKTEINKERLYRFGQDRKFFLFSESAARELAGEALTGTEFAIIFHMMSLTNYKSGYIAHGNNRPLTRQNIADKFGLSTKTTNQAFAKLIDLGIIAENITEQSTKYFFNPFIQYRGQWINKTLYEMFRKTKWAAIAREEYMNNRFKKRFDALKGGGQIEQRPGPAD